ncbi:MAG: STAS domain-containing protein [Sulfurisoma sp.]|nr:STAS domain-containing protein [Sulfurisoma sp.]
MPDPDDDDLMDLDFTVPGALPVAEEPRPAPSRSSVPPRIEEVARLFAGADVEPACSLLESVLHQEDYGDATELAWGMLFDLYHDLSRRQAFESLALDFAGKFEKSPPTWTPPTDGPPAVGKDGLATVTLSGVLGANAVQPLGKLRDMAGKVPGVRLDLGKVADADDVGCGALLETLRVFKKLKKACVMMGGEQIAAALAAKTVMGERSHEATWLLLLDLYQNLNRQEAFEETAVGYAVTFEVSPPSWETPKAAPAAAPAPAKPVDGCALTGEINGGGREHFAALLAHAGNHDSVLIDAGGLRRMDCGCADEFHKVLGELQAAGKTLRIRGARSLLVVLWRALGIDRIATIEPPKL